MMEWALGVSQKAKVAENMASSLLCGRLYKMHVHGQIYEIVKKFQQPFQTYLIIPLQDFCSHTNICW